MWMIDVKYSFRAFFSDEFPTWKLFANEERETFIQLWGGSHFG